ncbi:MAG: hypothetical protein ACO3IT_09030, partial [Ilumatobacteraceae bacterium]
MITVVGFAWGTAYKDEVQGWWDSVQALNPPADDVVIAYHPDDDCGVKDLPCRLVECRTRRVDAMYHAAIATIDDGWIAGLAMDDRFYPDAFACIPSDGFDVVANTIRFMSHGGVNPSAPERFATYPMSNHVMGTSWFTKDIWVRTGGYPNVYWSDWAFWWKCHVHGARWFKPAGVQVLVNDIRPNRNSSGLHIEADLEMHKFIAEYTCPDSEVR